MTYEPPECLDQAAREKWQELLPLIESIDVGRLDALAVYCQAWSRWQAAEQQVAALGSVVKSPTGFPVANPYLAIARDAQCQFRQWGEVLGLHREPSHGKTIIVWEDETLADYLAAQTPAAIPSLPPKPKRPRASRVPGHPPQDLDCHAAGPSPYPPVARSAGGLGRFFSRAKCFFV